MNFAVDPPQTQTAQFMDLGFSAINSLGERSGLITPTTIIQRPTYVAHWSEPYCVFGRATAVGMSEAKSDHDYNYKTEFQICKENKEFERQIIFMSRPPLDSTHIDTNTTNTKISHLYSTPVGTKMP